MPLTPLAYVQQEFEPWQTYCTIEGSSETAAEVLQRKIDLAEIEFLEYVDVDEDSITDQLTRHLLMLVKKQCFDIKHGSTEWDQDSKPQIIRDYERSLKWLEQYRQRTAAQAITGDITFTTKTRRYGSWFNETDATETTTTPE